MLEFKTLEELKPDEEILVEINDIQTKIKKLNKYCKKIIKRAEGIQNNLNIFDKDIQKEKNNYRSM
ncbi:MAG: hypothetical protein II119_03625 [Bacilli bacterium]|nr:hypothetical protein [Bacilli bacterium]